MSEAGYTLVEMLAAVAMLGLAFAGLTAGARVIGATDLRANGAAEQAARSLRVQNALDDLMAHQGPFLSDGRGGLNGSPAGFQFDCAAGACGAHLESSADGSWLVVREGAASKRYAAPQGGVFAYIDATGSNPTWPVNETRPQALTAIALTASGSQPVAAVRLWTEEPKDCVFDAIAQGCRS
ncbi:type II secretion system protein [Caulobacter sp. KR2-114]|uniref:type II secretion system protein n=1 Tax=Caulobacter sp. KR2-114 TaxID=3400912 RepID=UPI003C0A6EAD